MIALLKRAHPRTVTETLWQRRPRPAETSAPVVDESEIRKRFGLNAQLLSSPHPAESEARCYFADLPQQLQRVLNVQLRTPGDVSAVIETSNNFQWQTTDDRSVTIGGFFPKETGGDGESEFKDLAVMAVI